LLMQRAIACKQFASDFARFYPNIFARNEKALINPVSSIHTLREL
jgi:hypothetical protein